jgi:hypothetical protein
MKIISISKLVFILGIFLLQESSCSTVNHYKTHAITGLWIGSYTMLASSSLDPLMSYYFTLSIYPDGTVSYKSKGNANGNRNYISFADGTWTITGNKFNFSVLTANYYTGIQEKQTGVATYNRHKETLTDGTISNKYGVGATWKMIKVY